MLGFAFDTLPAGVAKSLATAEMYQGGLFPEEAAAIATSVASRRAEFAAGRACARAALGELGVGPVALPRDADRIPVWPQGFVGSISHTAGLCGALVARSVDVRALGLDLEAARAVDPQLAPMICRPDELAAIRDLPTLSDVTWVAVSFSAKEAFYKCHFPVARQFLEFHDVRLRLSANSAGDSGRFEVVSVSGDRAADLSARVQGAWSLAKDHLATTAWVANA